MENQATFVLVGHWGEDRGSMVVGVATSWEDATRFGEGIMLLDKAHELMDKSTNGWQNITVEKWVAGAELREDAIFFSRESNKWERFLKVDGHWTFQGVDTDTLV